jgi:hypothetical protein
MAVTRKTWHYDPETKEMVEGPGTPRSEGHSGDGWRFSDRHYYGLKAPDGTDISSRKKHREYMKRNGLTTVDDFKNTWKEKAKEREAFFTGTDRRESEQRKRDIAEAINRRMRNG